MMRAFAVLVLCALALPALAQSTAIKASTLIGMKVRDAESGSTGRIRDLVIDIGNNRVHYAELDMPGRMFAAPPERLEIPPAGKAAVYVPGDLSLAARSGMALVRASTLIGWEVTNEPGERVGRLLDLTIDPATGRVPFAVLQLDRPVGDGALHPVPLDGFAIAPRRESLMMTVDRYQLQPVGGFTLDRLEAGLADADFVQRHAAYADGLTPGGSGAGATRSAP